MAAGDQRGKRTIRTLGEWESHKEMASEPVLLQCGSPACVKCPAFSSQIETLKATHKFTHVYVDTHNCEEDLLDELQVTQLPAYTLVHGDKAWAQQAASPEHVATAVKDVCPPVLVLDEDF